MDNRRTKHKTERGGALLVVLWLSAALAAIAFSVATTVRSETDRVASSADGLRAWYLASGSVERGIQWMEWGPGVTNPDGSPRWQYNLSRLKMSYASGDAIVEMIPESSKLGINSATIDDLTRVISVITGDPGRAAEIASGIMAWRGSGGAPQISSSLSPTFQPRNASFQEIEELLSVPGVTPELFYGNYLPDAAGRLFATGGLRDSLSVWGGQGPFDINTVSPALMQAMGMDPANVEQIVERRRAQPFLSMGDVAGMGISAPRMGIGGNNIWTLRATARLRRPDGGPSEFVRTASATVKLVNPKQYFMSPVHVLRWYDDAWSQSALIPGAPVQ